MRSWVLKKMACRHAQKCPICSVGCKNCKTKNESDLLFPWNCDCEGIFSTCAYLQYVYMYIGSQILERHGEFSLDEVISPGLHCLWSLGSA